MTKYFVGTDKDKQVQFRDETGRVYWRSLGEINGVFPKGTFVIRRRLVARNEIEVVQDDPVPPGEIPT